MNTITPNTDYTTQKQRMLRQTTKPSSYHQSVSFKANPATIITEADKQILNVFSQHYGNIPERIGYKVGKLASSAPALKQSARFSLEKGVTSIKEKNAARSLLENIFFPFVNLPLYAGSWIIKQVQKIPIQSVKTKAEKLYKSKFLRVPRKINELDSKTDILKGMYDKTKNTVAAFAKEKNVSTEYLLEQLNKTDDSQYAQQMVKEANEYIKENLYKVSNKFFDKNTGNFNTAYERPLNRIVSGLVPVAFLANDAYNLSVLCGDNKETSKKEAKERKKQEISRVFTTAYIQLLTFGAFTKQVNTIPWFTPLTSACTVLFSEITSRVRLGKPVFFLTKDKAKELNKKNKGDTAAEKNDSKKTKTKQTPPTNPHKDIKTEYFIESKAKEPEVFTSFKSNNNKSDKVEKENKKDEPKKALINFKMFKNAVLVLISAGFALSFLKNSSYTKNSKLVQGIKSIGKYFKDKIYNPIAFKDFSIEEKEFARLTTDLKSAGCKEIAEGHEFIKNKYAKVADGTIKMYKSSLSSSKVPDVIQSTLDKIKASGITLSDKESKQIAESVKTALGLESTALAENKYSCVAKKASEIIRNKNVNITSEQMDSVTKAITDSIQSNVKHVPIQIETKAKPFIDIVTEPFKFIMSALKLPFKITSSMIKLAVSPVEKKAEKAALGEADLSKFEKNIHKVVTEIFGEKQAKEGKISQKVFANAIEKLKKEVKPYRKAEAAYNNAVAQGNKSQTEIKKLEAAMQKAQKDLLIRVNTAVEKSFNGITQSSNKNTDLAMMSKIASSAVTSVFLVADNYNMVMLKSDGENKEEAKEKANERIIQRLSALFYQTMLINWFNSTFKSTYNSSLKGMTAIVIPNTLTTEVLTRKSIGMPVGRKSMEELQEIDEKNENRTGFLGKYFKFMRLLTGKKPLKDRLPKDKAQTVSTSNTSGITSPTNLLEILSNKKD